MTVLDKIKAFFQRKKPPQVAAEKPSAKKKLSTATREGSFKTTRPQKKSPKATGKKRERNSKRKRTS